LLWECYHVTLFEVVNTAYHGEVQRKKIKKRPHHGNVSQRTVPIPEVVRAAVEEWKRHSRNVAPEGLPSRLRSGAASHCKRSAVAVCLWQIVRELQAKKKGMGKGVGVAE
jgi:hypothetical protein